MGNTSTTHLQGNVCIVTGATSGIGKETALELARQGATMVLAVRNTTLGESVKQEIIQATGNANIDVMACDYPGEQRRHHGTNAQSLARRYRTYVCGESSCTVFADETFAANAESKRTFSYCQCVVGCAPQRGYQLR
jgi:NAD(P)-dependent dehydrogenase (short-subunit alcohol dehydrogenase family)